MGNFEKLSVLVIVVIIVMILVVALYTWQDTGDTTTGQTGPTDIEGTPLNMNGTKLVDVDDDNEPWPAPPGPIEPLPLPPEPINPVAGRDNGDDLDTPVSEVEQVPDPAEVVGREPGGDNVGDLSRTETWTYVIKSGDTLSQISERELGTVRRQGEIKKLNPSVDWLRIRPDQPIKMPARGDALTPPNETIPGGRNSSLREDAPRAGTIATGDYYVTVAGDTIQSISKRAYGNVERWPGLWARNLSVVPSIDEPIKPGTRIFIPN